MKWHLDEDAAALLHTMTGTDDEPTPITLFVGESQDDDGNPVYGLHAYESDYPEEGVIPLVEFAPLAPLPDEPTQVMLEAVFKAHPGALYGYGVNFINDWKVAVAAHRAHFAGVKGPEHG